MHVTVVMAAYNEAAVIGDALRSIREQTYPDWDLIVVDDASGDGTPELVARIADEDPRVSLIRSTTNRGLATSLNRAIATARGELIARMDADDVSFPQRLEKQVAYLREHPEVDVLGTAAELVDEEGRKLGEAVRPADHETLVRELFTGSPFIHPSVMARRRFFEELGGYDQALRRAQDFDLWARGCMRFRYANLPDVLLRYRVARRPTLRLTAYAMYVLFRAGVRQGRMLEAARQVVRSFGGWFMAATGIREVRLR